MEAANSVSTAVFELKSDQFTLPNLRLLGADMHQLADQLEARVNQSPAFFLNTPVVIDLGPLPDDSDVDFALLVGLMRGHGMVPIGIRGGSKRQQELAELMELAVLAERRSAPATSAANAQTESASTSAERPSEATQKRPLTGMKPAQSKIITTPVRSGQRVYAAGADLIITAAVSSGAEVIADGNIHVYGTLRGRALAGVKGNRQARIFCHRLQAELIAVAGQYRVNEAIPENLTNNPVQVFLTDRKLNIEPI